MEYRIVGSEKAHEIARLTVCLTSEISERTGTSHFNLDVTVTEKLCKKLIQEGHYIVLAAFDNQKMFGFAGVCESYSLYAEGAFGIIQELYVQPEYRSKTFGKQLVAGIIDFAETKRWKRLELCTPPLPEFSGTVSFYIANGFEITGGHKMKYAIS